MGDHSRSGADAPGRETELMLRAYGLTTARILYHYPDHPHLLQTFVWQPSLLQLCGLGKTTAALLLLRDLLGLAGRLGV